MLETPKPSESDLIDGKEFGKRFQEWTKKHAKLIEELGQIFAENKISWGSILEQNAQKFSDNPAIKFEDKVLTYKEFNEKVNQYANYFISLGLKKGDVVKVLIKNRIELLLVYTANAKIGAISSLINTDLRKKTLVYSLNLTSGKIIIIGEECYETFHEIKSDINLSDAKQLCFIHDTGEMNLPEGYSDLPQAVLKLPVDNPLTTNDVKPQDVIAYIFTSGTTGLPKAALLTHGRVTLGGYVFGNMIAEFSPDDTIYIPLPFFHGTALMTGWPSTFVNGGALALARKFSVSHFWDDIRKFNATCFNYVGEICRYLMNQPPKPDDSENPVRAVIGNGLRPDIWLDFKKRFNIPHIGEFYGSSEGNGAFANVLNFDCTCGYSTGGYAIVRYDYEEDKPIRNTRGFMRKVRTGDVGLLLFESTEDSKFRGYTDEKATEAKLFRNIFKEGDVWFNTGDLMRNQGCNHAQFVDRLGDTFRWKGHNVSTTEIEQVLNIFDQISMSSVYGVKIPATDGRAGMAAIVPTSSVNDFDFKKLLGLFTDNLAPYAIPIFLRFKSGLSTTQTFKFKKVELKEEGFNLQNIEDPLFVMLPNESEYTFLSKEIYEKIQNQELNF
ncbi:MAG: long-chain-acyl-CoA synthetase [Candidatus Lokiarchaeota archaeon]|nr:long-chain-acyl-CoA synthetase [Candidatus Lokiarchaeota archaeon]